MNFKGIFNNYFNRSPKVEPVRLGKPIRKPSFEDKVISFVERYFNYFVLALIIGLIILFTLLCYALVGVSATESGTIYNHLNGVI